MDALCTPVPARCYSHDHGYGGERGRLQTTVLAEVYVTYIHTYIIYIYIQIVALCVYVLHISNQVINMFHILEFLKLMMILFSETMGLCLFFSGCGKEVRNFQCPRQDGCVQVPAGSPWPTCKCKTCHSTGS